MSGRIILSPKKAGETKTVQFDFTSNLGVSETISTQVVTASVWSGTDATPSAIVSGAATVSGAIVSQKIAAGVLGTVYELLCSVTTSAGQTLQVSAFLAIALDLV